MSKESMKECFGLNFGFLWDERLHTTDERMKCYECRDFDMCFKVSLIRNLQQIKLEMRKGVRVIRDVIGGARTDYSIG